MTLMRNIGVVIGALIIAVVLILIVQQINLLLFPLPEWVDVNNSEHLAQIMASLPLAALLMVEFSYIFGSLGAGLFIAKLAKEKKLIFVLIVGGLLTLAGFANLASVAHPLWFAILTSITYLPFTWIGSRIVRNQQIKNE